MAKPSLLIENLTFEHDWIAALEEMTAAIGEGEICVRWKWPHGEVRAIGFPPRIDERVIGILLKPQEQRGFQGGDITFSLPEEEECHYQKISGAPGQTCLVLRYPHCEHHPREHFSWCELAIATTPELLADQESAVPLQ
jgi:hypothetical protein